MTDFSNQDVRNRSFRGKNLEGANFRNATILGCDFTNARLEEADFSYAQAGQSTVTRAYWITSTIAGVLGGGIAGAYAFSDIGIYTLVAALIGGIVLAGAVTRTGGVQSAVGFTLAFGVMMAAVNAVMEFLKGNISDGFGWLIIAAAFSLASGVLIKEALKEFRKSPGTVFRKTKLSRVRFVNCALHNCDFSNASLVQVDWTGANFQYCKFPLSFDSEQIRQLCTSRQGVGASFKDANLADLNLIGVNLTEGDLSNCNVSNSLLNMSYLTNTIFVDVKAYGTDFSGAVLTGACIENWGINDTTKFNDVICDYVYLEQGERERKPASGIFRPGDFEKLVRSFSKTLDFFFHDGIDPNAFDVAIKNLMDNYGEEMGVNLRGFDDLGDGYKLVRFNVTNPHANKWAMHEQFFADYESWHQQFQLKRQKAWELQQQLIGLEKKLNRAEIDRSLAVSLSKKLAVSLAKLQGEERASSKFLQDWLYDTGKPIAQEEVAIAPHIGLPEDITSPNLAEHTLIAETSLKMIGGTEEDSASA